MVHENSAPQGKRDGFGTMLLNRVYQQLVPVPSGEAVEQDMCALVGANTMLKGIFRYTGTVRIDGRIEGEIHADGALLIGKNAIIQASINARSIVSCGKVTGDVIATENIKLLAPAVLKGSVQTPLLSVEEGACFKGNMDMPEPREESTALHEMPVCEAAVVAT